MRFLRWLTLTVLLLAASGLHAGSLRVVGDPARDARQTIQARKLLADDPDLASWNLGVTVQNRVATLWGPAPSVEVAFRAELALKTMIELAEVRNELFLSDQLKPMRVPLKIDNPPQFLPDRIPPPLPKMPRVLPRPDFSRLPANVDPLWPKVLRQVSD